MLLLNLVPTPLSLDGKLEHIVDSESEFEQFVQEIEQYDYLMEDSATAAQTRKYGIFDQLYLLQIQLIRCRFCLAKFYAHCRKHCT